MEGAIEGWGKVGEGVGSQQGKVERGRFRPSGSRAGPTPSGSRA